MISKALRVSASGDDTAASEFEKLFTSLLKKFSEKIASRADEEECETFARWCCACLEYMCSKFRSDVGKEGSDDANEEFQNVVLALGNVVKACLVSNKYHRVPGVVSLTLRKGDVGPKVNEVKDMPPVLRGVLYEALKRRKGVDASNIRRGYLEKMCDFSIASGSGGDVVLAERASEPLLKDCTAEDFETVVQAKLVKALRRNPIKSTLEAVSRMIRHVPRESVEKDSAQAFAEVVLPLVKHADESRRVAAIFVVKSFAKLLLAAIVKETFLEPIVKEITTNAPSAWAARVGICDTISVIAESLVGVAVENEEDARIAIETIEILAARLKSEKQVEAKNSLLRALSHCLQKCTSFSKNARDAIVATCSDVKDRPATLRALSSAIAYRRDFKEALGAESVKALIEIVKLGAQKTISRPDGVFALYLVCAAASADESAQAAATGVLKPECLEAYASAMAISKLPDDCAAYYAKSLELMFTMEKIIDKNKALLNATTLLALHPDLETRKSARDAIEMMRHKDKASSRDVMESLLEWVKIAEEEHAFPILGEELNAEATKSGLANFVAPFPTRYCGAAIESSIFYRLYADGGTLKRHAPIDDDAFCAFAGILITLSHHELVQSRTGSDCWTFVFSRFCRERSPNDIDFNRIASECANHIVDELQNGKNVQSNRKAVRAVSAISSNVALDIILEGYLLDPTSAFSDACRRHESEVTENDVKVFKTPIGRLSTDPKDSPSTTSGPSSSNSGASASSTRTSLRAKKTLRPSQAGMPISGKSKPGVGQKDDPREVQRRAQIQKESETRERLSKIAKTIEDGLEIISNVFDGVLAYDKNHRSLLFQGYKGQIPVRPKNRLGDSAANVAYDVIFPLCNSHILHDSVCVYCLESFFEIIASMKGITTLAGKDRSSLQLRAKLARAVVLCAQARDGFEKPPLLDPLSKESIEEDADHVKFEVGVIAEALEALSDNFAKLGAGISESRNLLSLIFPILSRAIERIDCSSQHKMLCLEILGDYATKSCKPMRSIAAAVRCLTKAINSSVSPKFTLLAEDTLLSVAKTSINANDVQALVHGCADKSPEARKTCLEALSSLPNIHAITVEDMEATDEILRDIAVRLFIAKHDSNETFGEMASTAYANAGVSFADEDDNQSPTVLLPFLSHECFAVREATVKAFATAVEQLPTGVASVLAKLFALFASCTDASGRAGVVTALGASSNALQKHDVPLVTTLLLKALSDESLEVREASIDAGKMVIAAHGESNTETLLKVFEGYFDKPSDRNVSEEIQDYAKSGAVVFLASLAVHLDSSDPKVKQILERLLEVLETPSESVQRKVADAFPPLMKQLATEEEKRALIEDLLGKLSQGKSYAVRRGAAFGIAGAVKGIGMGSLKGMGVMDSIKALIEDKKSAQSREGALMCFELLVERLGRLFEPYVVTILPMLLVSFGDQTESVRLACEGAAQKIMKNLSAQGVKLVLPALLDGLRDDQWRTKSGSAKLLGAMSSCAPKQLGGCLPQIVPRLSKALVDTHPKVVDAASLALKSIGDVIKNPEIQALSKYLLGAIAHPTTHTEKCIDILLETTFVNVVDAPSLALIIPIISRGLKERKADMKKKAAKIAGNTCALVADPKDIVPYIPELVSELKKSLVDPNPEVRSVTARALGSLLEGAGEEHFEDLIPWLTEKMQGEGSGVERAGAAQGLAECLNALGSDRFVAILPEVYRGCANLLPRVREGHLHLLKFLPLSVGQKFEPYLSESLTTVLTGLADEEESVRDAALGAGRVFVSAYSHSESALDLILPAIETGTNATEWRIRHCALELLGSMLFRIVGTSGKARVQRATAEEEEEAADEEGISTEAQGEQLTRILGRERHLDVLAVIYLLRCDGQSQIRNDAVHVWKTVVANTPRTLRATLPRIAKRILQAYSQGTILSSLKTTTDSSEDDKDEEDDDEERKLTGARAVSDLTRKLGERFIEGILPILRTVFEANEEEEEQIMASDKITKAGAAYALAEIFDCAEESTHEGGIVSPKQATLFTSFVEICLSNPNAGIQDAGGVAFKAMNRWNGGKEAVAKIVPDLLHGMDRDSSSEQEKANSLNGLRVALKAQPNILAVALPKLAAPPITPDKAKTLGALVSVAGPALPPHLDSIIPRLLDAIEEETYLKAGETEEEIAWTKRESFDDVSKFPAFNALRSTIAAAPEDCGDKLLSEISDALTELAKMSSLKKVDEAKEKAKARRRAVSSIALADFATTFSGYDNFVDAQVLVKTLSAQFSDKHECARDAAWGALSVVVSTIQKDELMEFVECCHASIRQCREQAKRLRKQQKVTPGSENVSNGQLSSSKYTIIPALTLPRALEALSKIYLAGVLHGEEPEHRQRAAEALQLAISCSTKDGLKAHVVSITGPLIRVVSDKFPSSVRAALLDCLATLVEKGGIGLKPFVPQLQTTFLKSLNDAKRAPRVSSAKGLGLLMSIQVRVDPLAADLAKKLANNEVEDECVEAHFEAARGVARYGGSKITPESIEMALNASTVAALTSEDENIRVAASRCAAAFASLYYTENDDNREPKREEWLKTDVEKFASENITIASREGKSKILSEFARLAPESILSIPKDKATTLNNLAKCASDNSKAVKSNCAKGLGYLGESCVRIEGASSDTVAKILQVLTKLLRDASSEVRENSSKAIRSIIKCASLKDEIDDITIHFPIFLADLAEVAIGDRHELAKKSAERAVFRALRLDLGAEVALPHLKQGGSGAAARGKLSDLNLRKLANLPDESEDEFDPSAEDEELVLV